MANNYDAWKIEPLDSLDSIGKEEFFKHLIGWAILAPNSHNVQPWLFKVRPEEDAIDVFVKPEGILAVSDKNGRQAHISVGCAIANLLTAAELYGYSSNIDIVGEKYPLPVAHIQIGQCRGFKNLEEAQRKFMAMKNRRMNRGKYDPSRLIPIDLWQKMERIAEAAEVKVNFITDAPTKFAIAEIQYQADQVVISKTNFRHELAEYFLPNDTANGIGMPGNTFGLTDARADEVHAELKREGVIDAGLVVGFTESGRDGIRSAYMLVIISVDRDEPREWINSGIAFEKMVLEAQELGISVAVHAAMVEVGLLNASLRLRLKQKERPTVIFRLGYATKDYPHSPRLAIEAALLRD